MQITARANRLALRRERLRLLDTNLPTLAQQSRSSRTTRAVSDLVMGGVMILTGFLVPPGTPSRYWIWGYGAAQTAGGIVGFVWAPAVETETSQYLHMPFARGRERRARVRFGERALEDMAADAARRRYLGGVGSIGLPLALTGIVYADPLFNGRPFVPSTFDVLFIALTGAQIVLAVYELFVPSPVERFRGMYQQQVAMRRAELFGQP